MWLCLISCLVGILIITPNALGSSSPFIPNIPDAKLGDNQIFIDQSFDFLFQSKSTNNSLILIKAMKRYKNLINSSGKGVIQHCSIIVDEVDVDRIIGSDESYRVDISMTGECSITANKVWGIIRGLESFSQMLIKLEDGSISMNYAPVEIVDSPRYPHRGLMIDTARHFLPVTAIQQVIDSLPYSKINVLHWHMVDAESFPIQTPSAPTMSQGAYSAQLAYTMDDLKMLKNYAYDRGVEIIFELDVPGHAASWAAGKPALMANCLEKYSYNINDFALNPALDETYETLQAIISDIVSATKTQIFHLGGDEVVYGCWKEDQSISAFMKLNGITTYDEMLGHFVSRADSIVRELKVNTIIHWEEVFTAGCNVQADTVFQVWTDSSKVSQLTAANYSVIASPSNYWYLNILTSTWQVMYSYDPTLNLTTQSQKDRIVGGEAAIWGEYVDEVNLQSSIYPRLSAVAERLWSPSTSVDVNKMSRRLQIHRCRLINRNVASSPVKPGYCDVHYI